MTLISHRRLEAISIGLFFYLPLAVLIIVVINLPLIIAYWPITLIYLVWMYFDRETPFTHGRSSDFIRKNFLWQYFRNYFPQKLVKTADLDPQENHILALFPHGIWTTSAFSHFFSKTSDFFKLYPGINVTPVTLDINFYVPIIRELFLAAGTCSCDKKSLMYRLTKPEGGEAVLLVPGGAAEALLTVQGAYRLVLKDRKGFIKVAHQAGACVIPVFAFGETNTYNHVNFDKDSFAFKLQNSFKKITGVSPCIAWGRSVFFKYFGVLPHRTPVTTVVGKPIKLKKIEEPTEEIINESHEKFIKELNNLFETHKHKYIENPDNVHLVIEEGN